MRLNISSFAMIFMILCLIAFASSINLKTGKNFNKDDSTVKQPEEDQRDKPIKTSASQSDLNSEKIPLKPDSFEGASVTRDGFNYNPFIIPAQSGIEPNRPTQMKPRPKINRPPIYNPFII